MAERWTVGGLADRVSRLVWAVDPFNRDVVRGYCDEIEALAERERRATRWRAEAARSTDPLRRLADTVSGMFAALEAENASIEHGVDPPGDASDWWGEQDVPGMCASFARAFLLSVERADRAEEERDRLAALLDARGRLGARADNP